MTPSIPTVDMVRERLQGLRSLELDALASSSGVPVSTLWKIRTGVTPNPGLETVRKFFHLLPASPAANDAHAAQVAQQGAGHA